MLWLILCLKSKTTDFKLGKNLLYTYSSIRFCVVNILGIIFQVKTVIKGRDKGEKWVLVNKFNRTSKLECKGSVRLIGIAIYICSIIQ